MSEAHMSSSASATGKPEKKAAGAFDVRNIIGALLGLYGVVLLVMGLIGPSEDDLAKTGGFNANLWVGLGMLAVGIGFILWSRLRPIVVEAHHSEDNAPEHS
jgi:LPXTG-motif cell wall-anchored protein